MNASSAPSPHSGLLTLRDNREEVEQAEHEILNALERFQYDRASLFAVRMALEEALSNAFKHGNKCDSHKTVRLEFVINPEAITIDIEDQGEGFDPACVPDPTDQENVEIPCGRGLKLIHAFMTDVEIVPPGNRLRMRYDRPQSP